MVLTKFLDENFEFRAFCNCLFSVSLKSKILEKNTKESVFKKTMLRMLVDLLSRFGCRHKTQHHFDMPFGERIFLQVFLQLLIFLSTFVLCPQRQAKKGSNNI